MSLEGRLSGAASVVDTSAFSSKEPIINDRWRVSDLVAGKLTPPIGRKRNAVIR